MHKIIFQTKFNFKILAASLSKLPSHFSERLTLKIPKPETTKNKKMPNFESIILNVLKQYH